MSSGVAVASTEDWLIIKFSAGDRHRYRFRGKQSSADVPKIESRFSRYGRLRAPANQFHAILGIVWDIESSGWGDASTHLDPKKAFLLVKWKDHRDTWERASHVLTLYGLSGRKNFLRQLACRQEEAFEEKGVSLPEYTRQQRAAPKFARRLKNIRAKIAQSRMRIPC